MYSEVVTVNIDITSVMKVDTVAINKAVYNAKRDTLELKATSSAGVQVTLIAKALDAEGALMDSKKMSYRSNSGEFNVTLRKLISKPALVEVISSGGGSVAIIGAEID